MRLIKMYEESFIMNISSSQLSALNSLSFYFKFYCSDSKSSKFYTCSFYLL